MALEGSVGEFGLVDIFQLIAMQKKAGVLTASCKGKKDISVYFLDGAFIRAVSGDENEQFSDVMISARSVTIVQLKSALRITPKEASLPETFVKLHYIDSEEAIRWNKILTENLLFNLLLWKEGHYIFTQETVHSKAYETPMSVEWVLMEGMRQSDEWPALLKAIPSPDGIYERANAEETIDGEGVSEEMGPIRFIDGARTIKEVICHAGMGNFSVYKELSDLVKNGTIRACQPKEEIKKKVLPDISFNRIKEFLDNPVLINKLVGYFIMILLVIFLRPILFGDKPFLEKVQGHFQQLRAVSLGNKRDMIAFSLNLYYLKRNQYPETLDKLKEERFINQEISLDDWAYTHDRYSFRLTPLHIVE